jgi:broad specificity phosphatase PhoE
MTRLILVRHGQSLANAGQIFAGHTNFDLSELGHAQAALVADYLVKHEKISAIYSSDLLRAYHTATPTAERLSLPIERDVTLREIYAGDWDGRTFEEIRAKYPEDFRIWYDELSHARPTGGESIPEVYRRIVPHVLSICRRHDGETILITSHATVVRAFHSYACGYSEDGLDSRIRFCGNAAINFYEIEGDTARELCYDFSEHLGALATSTNLKTNA